MVYVPYVTKPLVRRKSRPLNTMVESGTRNLPLGKKYSTRYGNGGGPVSTIPSGVFAGRTAGGGGRADIFGNRKYGSGYPGYPIGVAGYGFPFFFWPLAFGETFMYGANYIHSDEYGSPDNSTRPGGPMVTWTYPSKAQGTTFYLVVDDDSANSVSYVLQKNCSHFLSSSFSNKPVPYSPSDPNSPKPEEAIQYYRASSAALMLEGYNNTAQLSDDTSLPDTPLPTNIDMTLLTCLNETIGRAIPLVNAANPIAWNPGATGSAYAISSFWLLFYFLSMIF